MRFRQSLLAALALPGMAAAASADTMPFAAHRAVYDLSLLSSTGRKAPESVSGRIIMEFSGTACDGYVSNFRLVTDVQQAEAEPHVIDVRSTAYEDAEGKVFNFKSETKVDQITTDAVDGHASHASDGAMVIDLTKPFAAKIDRDKGIVFPTEHMRHILNAAREGKKLLEVQAFDGSETGEKIFNTLTIIGAPVAAPADEKPVQIDALKGMRRWPVTISYFDAVKQETQAQYIASFDLYENGISRSLKLDYGDYALKGDMSELTYISDGACKK
jgi:EipB-like